MPVKESPKKTSLPKLKQDKPSKKESSSESSSSSSESESESDDGTTSKAIQSKPTQRAISDEEENDAFIAKKNAYSSVLNGKVSRSPFFLFRFLYYFAEILPIVTADRFSSSAS